MALKATIYKVNLNIADMDQHIYSDYQLTLAQHPSETLERMMVRLLAFARFASEDLSFTQDLFETSEPALMQKDLTGHITKWIEVGSPDEDKVKKASSRCDQIAVVSYGAGVSDWYKKASKLKTLSNLQVWQLSQQSTLALAEMCQRGMQLQLNIMDGQWSLISDDAQVDVEWTQLQ